MISTLNPVPDPHPILFYYSTTPHHTAHVPQYVRIVNMDVSKFKKLSFSDSTLYRYLFYAVCAEVCLLLFVTFFSQSGVAFVPYRYGDGANGEKLYSVQCTVRADAGFVGPIALFLNALFLLYGVYEAYQIRNLDDSINEAKYIAISIYNVFVVGALVVMVCFVVPDPTIVTLLKVVFVSLETVSAIALLGFPKIKAIRNNVTVSTATIMEVRRDSMCVRAWVCAYVCCSKLCDML